MNTLAIVGILLMLPFAYGALFQSRPKNWVPEHASIAMLEIAGLVIGLILFLIGVFA
ncbi:hypothetical protein GTP41_24810 [Pseudoduganella sp. DS3]|uniref:Uncharacterized protein n=1 Tax=Pseudoduganella guangdongensis TaxID=2692179 RepID=A0A6N9HQ05_9BURK|nr:hypothetical protein [Pseudoduganella guangdongensis]MYN05323.1 hypothetical protein [Pseudoduganella guangdongensis]